MPRWKFDLLHSYEIGPSNGTVAVSEIHLSEDNSFIAVENVSMIGGDVLLNAVPSRTRLQRQGARTQSAVTASLDRSLKEHADVWAELSKY
jgi:hypothetical protein